MAIKKIVKIWDGQKLLLNNIQFLKQKTKDVVLTNIHSIDTIINDNEGVAVMIDASHNCVQCRGVKHGGASMKTSKLTGAFKSDPSTRAEYYEFIKGYN